MLKSYGVLLCAGLVFLAAGCGVPRSEYLALETKYTQAQSETKAAGETIRYLEGQVTVANDKAERSQQEASQANAELKLVQAKVKSIEANEARMNAQMAQVKAHAQKIMIDLKDLLKWLNADTSAPSHPINGGETKDVKVDETSPPPVTPPE